MDNEKQSLQFNLHARNVTCSTDISPVYQVSQFFAVFLLQDLSQLTPHFSAKKDIYVAIHAHTDNTYRHSTYVLHIYIHPSIHTYIHT